MADTTALKNRIRAAIKANDNQEITGPVLQQALLDMVDELNGATETEASQRQSSDSTLQQNINTEASQRQSSDSTLQQNINTEASQRQNGDSTLQQNINTEASQRQNGDTQLNNLITGIKTNIDNGYVYAGIAIPSTTPASGKVFYLALIAGTYTNFDNIVVSQGINILKYNGLAWLLDSFLGLDDVPIAGSDNLVKSRGVLNSIIKDGSAFDLSAYNNNTTYPDLEAALTALNALTLTYKKGGMSVKFIRTSDNEYVQARCMSQNFTTDVTQWQVVDVEPTVNSRNLIESNAVFEVKDILNTVFGINSTTEIEPTFTTGHYINNLGQYLSVGSAQISNQIQLHQGETIIVFTSEKITDVYGVIAVVKSSYPYDVKSIGTNNKVCCYTAIDDCSVVLSSPVGIITSVYSIRDINIENISNTLTNIQTYIQNFLNTENINIGEDILAGVAYTENDYINSSGDIGHNFTNAKLYDLINVSEIESCRFIGEMKPATHIGLYSTNTISSDNLVKLYTPSEVINGILDITIPDSANYLAVSCFKDSDAKLIVPAPMSLENIIKAIQEEIDGVNKYIGYTVNNEDNLLIGITVHETEYIYYDGLVYYNFNSAKRYDLVDISDARELLFTGDVINNVTYIGLYSDNAITAETLVQLISPSSVINGELIIKVPTTAKYIGISCRKTSDATLSITSYKDVQKRFNDVNKRIDDNLIVAEDTKLLPITENPLRIIKESAGLASAFETWGFIGDSMASGEIWGWVNTPKELTQWKTGKILSDGTVEENNDYAISNPIKASGYYPTMVVDYANNTGLSSSMCVIAKTDSSGNILSVGKVGGTATKYTCSLNSANDYIIVCYPLSNVPTVRCVSRYFEDNYNISWGQYMCRLCGSTGTNYSVGGGTAKKFVLSQSPFTADRGLSKLLADSQKQGYIIGFGVNDNNNEMYSGGNVTNITNIAADINLSDSSLNADTFAGWYARIIQDIKSQNEDSMIFLVTIPQSESTWNEVNTIIRAMPTIFESYSNTIFVLDLNEYCPINTWYQSHFKLNGLHLNGQGYQYVAYQMCTYIDWLIQKYPSYFKGISLIGKALTDNPT